MKRQYLDALIESYLVYASRGERERDAVSEELKRLSEIQRGLGLKDYFERQGA